MKRLTLALLMCLAGCSPMSTTDGGIDGGGTGGGSGGGAGGGGGSSGFDGGAFTFSCSNAPIVADAGVDQGALGGPECQPGDLDALVQTCRVEPQDYFFDSRCPGFNMAGSARIQELFAHSGIYSCAAFGRDRMHCVAQRVSECRPDGGAISDTAITRIVDECTASTGGAHYNAACLDACTSSNTACFVNCRTCGFEACASCSFECGRQFIACRNQCPPP